MQAKVCPDQKPKTIFTILTLGDKKFVTASCKECFDGICDLDHEEITRENYDTFVQLELDKI